ncbi:hypothetical protein ACFYXM_28125 [Streptomyces sp. NPDC002476]|uniref:hypothetical protein n=1 Tax=Streptomyces sp. NPDC002476 TaxID=3364648 RepID=UPI0036B9E078
MADDSSTQPQAGMAALRARKGTKKTAAAPKGTKASETAGETAHRTPPRPMFPKTTATQGSSGTAAADAPPAEQEGGRSVAVAPTEQQPVRVPTAGPEATNVEGADAGPQQAVASEPVEAPAQGQVEHARDGGGVSAVTTTPEADGAAAPVETPAAKEALAQGGDFPSSPDIPVQARTPEAGQRQDSSGSDRVADAQEKGDAVPPWAEAPSPVAVAPAVERQEVGEATADGVRSDGRGFPGTSLERRSGQAAVAFASQWDRHVPPPVNEGFPRAEEILNQRFITREALNASVPAELQIPHRLQLLKVASRINHIPPADLVAVAVDWFLRGGKASADDMLPPWNGYTGHGTSEEIRPAEVVLNERFITREPLKSQVPADLQLNHRLAMYRVLNRLDKMPVADIVTVALDRWLRVMRF